MSVKGNLKKLASTYNITPTKNTIPGILGEIAVALGGTGNGKTIAEQVYNIALAKGYVEPESAAAKYTVSFNLNGGKVFDLSTEQETELSPAEVEVGESLDLPLYFSNVYFINDTVGSDTLLGWAKTSTAQSATVTTSFTPDKNTTLYAVWGHSDDIEEGQQTGDDGEGGGSAGEPAI